MAYHGSAGSFNDAAAERDFVKTSAREIVEACSNYIAEKIDKMANSEINADVVLGVSAMLRGLFREGTSYNPGDLNAAGQYAFDEAKDLRDGCGKIIKNKIDQLLQAGYERNVVTQIAEAVKTSLVNARIQVYDDTLESAPQRNL